MSESLSSWLALREPADVAARSATLTRFAFDALPPARPLRILDLGTGTGSNVRFLRRFLPEDHEWLVVDRDPELLTTFGCDPRIGVRQMDLGELDPSIFDGRHLVTASALLDLVSRRWLRDLAAECRRIGAVALFALTYNGRSHCTPAEPEDDRVRELLNEHQRQSDKGFGRAAGPDAAEVAEAEFRAAGFDVRRDASDWVLRPDAQQLQRQLVEGWAAAACEIAPADSAQVRSWLARRLAHIDAGRSTIAVCHDDLAAWLQP